MEKMTGFTAESVKKLLLDAGVFVKNYVIGTDTYATVLADDRIIGATAGGGSFEIKPTIRKVEIDGVSGDVVGLTRIDDWKATIKANVKEVSANTIVLGLGSAKLEDGPVGYKKITLKTDIEDVDYLTNVTWLGTISGETNPVAIQFINALSTGGLSVTVTDKGEAVIPMEFTAHAKFVPLTRTWTMPVEIYYPDVTVAE